MTKRILFLGALVVFAVSVLPAQTTLTNDEVIKLAKSGLSDDFVVNLVEQQGGRLSSDVSNLVELKAAGVSERILTAVSRKGRSQEHLNSDSLVSLAKAGFSDSFIVDLMSRQPSKFAVDASRIMELKKAGLSERVLSQMVVQGSAKELPGGSVISIRLIEGIDSERNNAGDEFRASLQDPIVINGEVVAPKGADARVRLAAEKESGKMTGRTELKVELISVTFNGRAVPVNSSTVEQYSGSRGARTAKSAAAVGAAGAIIGAIAGGGKGAAIGAASGAAVGAGAQVFMGGQKVKIPSETLLSFTTQGTVKIP